MKSVHSSLSSLSHTPGRDVIARAFHRSASSGEDVFLGRQQWRFEDGADDGREDHGGRDVGQEQGNLLSTHRQTDRAF